MKQIVFFSCVLIVFAACNKDKFQTKPSLELVSTSDKTISQGGELEVVLAFTDKEGDVTDSVYFRKIRKNQREVTPLLRSEFRYKIPYFPNSIKGELVVKLDYTTLVSAQNPPTIPLSNPPRRESDTLDIRLAIQDKAGNTSDSITINDVIIIRQ